MRLLSSANCKPRICLLSAVEMFVSNNVMFTLLQTVLFVKKRFKRFNSDKAVVDSFNTLFSNLTVCDTLYRIVKTTKGLESSCKHQRPTHLQRFLQFYFQDKFWMNKEKFTRAGFERATSGLTCRCFTN